MAANRITQVSTEALAQNTARLRTTQSVVEVLADNLNDPIRITHVAVEVLMSTTAPQSSRRDIHRWDHDG